MDLGGLDNFFLSFFPGHVGGGPGNCAFAVTLPFFLFCNRPSMGAVPLSFSSLTMPSPSSSPGRPTLSFVFFFPTPKEMGEQEVPSLFFSLPNCDPTETGRTLPPFCSQDPPTLAGSSMGKDASFFFFGQAFLLKKAGLFFRVAFSQDGANP